MMQANIKNEKNFSYSSQYDQSSPYAKRSPVALRYGEEDKNKQYLSPYERGRRNQNFINPSLLSNDIFYNTPSSPINDTLDRNGLSPKVSARKENAYSPLDHRFNGSKNISTTPKKNTGIINDCNKWPLHKETREVNLEPVDPAGAGIKIVTQTKAMKVLGASTLPDKVIARVSDQQRVHGARNNNGPNENPARFDEGDFRESLSKGHSGDNKSEPYDVRKEMPNYWNLFAEKSLEVTSSYRADFQNFNRPKRSLTPTSNAGNPDFKHLDFNHRESTSNPAGPGVSPKVSANKPKENPKETTSQLNRSPKTSLTKIEGAVGQNLPTGSQNSQSLPKKKLHFNPIERGDSSMADYTLISPRSQTPTPRNKSNEGQVHEERLIANSIRIRENNLLKPMEREWEHDPKESSKNTFVKERHEFNEPNNKRFGRSPQNSAMPIVIYPDSRHKHTEGHQFLEFELKNSKKKEQNENTSFKNGDPKLEQPSTRSKQESGERSQFKAYDILCNNCINEHMVLEKVQKSSKEKDSLLHDRMLADRQFFDQQEVSETKRLEVKTANLLHYDELKQQVHEKNLRKEHELAARKHAGPGDNYLFGNRDELVDKHNHQIRDDLRQNLARQVEEQSHQKEMEKRKRGALEKTGLEIESGFKNNLIPTRQKFIEGLDEQVNYSHNQQRLREKEEQAYLDSENAFRTNEAAAEAQRSSNERKMKEEYRDMILAHIEQRTNERKMKKLSEQREHSLLANKKLEEEQFEEQKLKRQNQEKKMYLNEWLDSQIEYKRFSDVQANSDRNQPQQYVPTVVHGAGTNNHKLDRGQCECDRCKRPILSRSDRNDVSMMKKF